VTSTFSPKDFDRLIKELDEVNGNEIAITIKSHLEVSKLPEKTVVGFDIYKYSKYPSEKQILIPFILEKIFSITEETLQEYESLFFPKSSPLKENFIDQGDGGYLILDNPIHGLLFICYFDAALRLFNCGKISQNLVDFIEPLNVRYTMAMGHIFKFIPDNEAPSGIHNFGEGIVRCARILSKDKLNRFLIDDRTFNWFMGKFNGIENLIITDVTKIIELLEMGHIEKASSEIFPSEKHKDGKSGIYDLDILKLNDINAKEDIMKVYNLHIKLGLSIKQPSGSSEGLLIAIGNLNTQGLS
jgi:hypothetical protein